MLQLAGYHTAQPSRESLFQGAEKEAPTNPTRVLWTWRRLTTVFLMQSCGGYCSSKGCWSCCYEPSGPYITKVRAVHILSTKSSTFSVGVGLRQCCPLSSILFVIFMDRISRRSRREESVWFGDRRICVSALLLASSRCDLQHTLGRFAAKCEAVGMKVSTSKSEAMVLCWKKVDCSLWVGSELLPQAREFKYLGEREINRQIGAMLTVMWALYRTSW